MVIAACGPVRVNGRVARHLLSVALHSTRGHCYVKSTAGEECQCTSSQAAAFPWYCISVQAEQRVYRREAVEDTSVVAKKEKVRQRREPVLGETIADGMGCVCAVLQLRLEPSPSSFSNDAGVVVVGVGEGVVLGR